MSHLIGRGRTARETYPQSPGAGSGSAIAAIAPLSRQRFIDGDTTRLGKTGSASDPYQTIAEFRASRTNASVADAAANYVGWLMPALGGYVGDVSFRPYVSTELRADSASFPTGTSVTVTGNVTWANLAGGTAPTSATVAMHNVPVTGSFTVTDDAGAPVSIVIFSGDELGAQAVSLLGGFVSNTTVKLQAVLFENAQIANGINAGVGASRAEVALTSSIYTGGGAISARALTGINSSIAATTIDTFTQVRFNNCVFSGSPVLTTPDAKFDGPSWLSFLEAGGTTSATTIVLVVGGYNGGEVVGANLTAASTSVSLDGGGGVTGGYEKGGNHYSVAAGDNDPDTVTLLTSAALPGDTMLITRGHFTGAPALAVVNGGAGTIGTIPAVSRGFVLAQYNGTNWLFAAGGSLAA